MNDIIKAPNPILHEVSEQVRLPLSKEDKQLLDEMYAYVKDPESRAIGLSAVQVGVLKRMCAIIIENQRYKLVNPRIIKRSKELTYYPEGCLSVSEEHDEPVKRYESISVMAYDAIQNKNIIINARGLLARCLQHEIDHMDGILFTDRINEVEK